MSSHAMGSNTLDLTEAFAFLLLTPACAEGEGEGEGQGEAETQETGSKETGSGEGESSTEKNSEGTEAAKLKDEAAKNRIAAREAAKERDEIAKKLREYEDKEKTDLEKAQRDLKEREDSAAKVASENAELKLSLALHESEEVQKFADPKVAIALMDRTVVMDKDGNVDPKGLAAECKRLMDTNALRLKTDNAEEEEGTGTTRSGGANNGRKKSGEADQEALMKKFPALRGR